MGRGGDKGTTHTQRNSPILKRCPNNFARKKKFILINISTSSDWQLGMTTRVTFVGGFDFQEKKHKRRQHPPFFPNQHSTTNA